MENLEDIAAGPKYSEWDIEGAEAVIDYEDGIYFNMPDEVYFRIKRLSSSGIQKLLQSAANFWSTSWLNPDKEENEELSAAQIAVRVLGKAYHCALLEPDQLPVRYAKEPDYKAIKGILTNGTQVGDKLAEYGQAKKKSGEAVMDQARRLVAFGYTGAIKCLMEAEFAEELGGREALSAKIWDDIQRDMERIKKNPEVEQKIQGGFAEVVVLWTCPASGIKMKSKMDYLKPDEMSDFKTFENQGKELWRHVADSFRYNRYYIQGCVYWNATEAVRSGELPVLAFDNAEQVAMVRSIRQREQPHKIWYVMQEKKGVPNFFAAEYPVYNDIEKTEHDGIGEEQARLLSYKAGHLTGLFRKAQVDIRQAKQRFLRNIEVYGVDGEPWFTERPIRKLTDDMFNGFWLEEGL